MMKRTLLLGLGAATLLVGCAANQTASVSVLAAPSAADTVALGELGLPVTANSTAPRTTYFGAGDVLGQEIFTVYVASLRANEDQFYATGTGEFIDQD